MKINVNEVFWNVDKPKKIDNYICDLGGFGVSLGWFDGERWMKMWGTEPIIVYGWIEMPKFK